MKTKKIVGWILKAPLILLILASFGASVYAAMGKVPGLLISWGAPGIIGGMIVSYLIGAYLIHSEKKEETQEEVSEEVSEE